MDLPESLAATAEQQRGLLTVRQLLDGGVPRAAVRWALGRRYQLVLPRVVALFTGELDAGQRRVAGCLWAGPAGQVAGLTAARWHGLPGIEDDGVVRLLVGWGEGTRREGFAVRRRTSRLDPRPWSRGPLAVCSRARAVVDAARGMRDVESTRQLLIAGVQRGLVRERDLRAELEAGPVRGLVAADGTPLPTPDFWLDDVGLAGQVHSRAYHLREQHWESTVAADTVLGEYGVPVVAVTPTGFRRDPAGFRHRVERAYLAARRVNRRPAVAMTPRGTGVVA